MASEVRTFMIQVAVLANHQQGRDTHLRLVQLYSPVRFVVDVVVWLWLG